ncbi:MAG: hypothetical protein R6V34_11725 [Bacteroidales bacterium]
MKNILSSAVLMMLAIISANAQADFRPGYIITNEFDTIHGYINNRGEIKNSVVCSFKTDEDSDAEDYEPGQIFGYRFENGKYYITKEAPVNGDEQTLFLEYLVDGIADLYYFRDVDGVHYYIQKEDIRMIELTNKVKTYLINGEQEISRQSKRYIGALRAALADCKEIQPQINDVKFTHKALAGITEQYHDYVCIDGQECVIYMKEIKPVKIEIGPYFNWNINNLNYKLSTAFNPDPILYGTLDFEDSFPSAGFRLELSSERASKILGLAVEAEFGKASYNVSKTVITGSHEERVKAYKNSVYTSAALSLTYNYFRGKVRPYANIGAGALIIINEEGLREYESYIEGELNISAEYEDVPYSPTSFLLRAQAGLKFINDWTFVPYIGGRIDYIFSNTYDDYFIGASLLPYKQNITSIAISMGILF